MIEYDRIQSENTEYNKLPSINDFSQSSSINDFSQSSVNKDTDFAKASSKDNLTQTSSKDDFAKTSELKIDNWDVWLNMNVPNNEIRNEIIFKHSLEKKKIIGKNAIFYGNQKHIYRNQNITVIGNARIYNDTQLWKMIQIEHHSNELEYDANQKSLHLILELYQKYGIEQTLDFLDGDFSFLLLDFNIYGEESYLYIVKDPFGFFPLYKMEYPDFSQKKVKFTENHQTEFVEHSSIKEMRESVYYNELPQIDVSWKSNIVYGFSSRKHVQLQEKINSKPLKLATYQCFTHSHKVSATWKKSTASILFYRLPFYSTYICEKPFPTFSIPDSNKTLEKQILISFQKRFEWIRTNYPLKKIGILYNIVSSNRSSDYFLEEIGNTTPYPLRKETNKLENQMLDFFFDYEMDNYTNIGYNIIHSTINSIDFLEDSSSLFTLETKYPTILQKLKTKLKSNDPAIIRAHFIPTMLVKYIRENYPEVRVFFMAEKFTYEWLEINIFERKKLMNNNYFLEKIRAWTEIFLSHGLEIFMPFLDRMLIQTPDQYSRV